MTAPIPQLADEMTKTCAKCAVSKSIYVFSPRSKSGARHNWCNTCRYAPKKAERIDVRAARKLAADQLATEKRAAHAVARALNKAAKKVVKGNVTIISDRANRIRNDGTAEEHERVSAWMRSQGLK